MLKLLGSGVALALAVTAWSTTDGDELIRRKPNQQAIVNAAHDDYTYDTPMQAVRAIVPATAFDNEGVVGTAPLDLTISRAHLKSTSSPNPKSEVLAKISTKIGYAPLHIPKGDSYLWRNKRQPTKGKRWALWIVPDSLNNKDLRKWKRWKGEIEFSDVHTDPHAPHLVYVTKTVRNGLGVRTDLLVYGACIDDPTCTAGHCGYGGVQ